MIVNRRREMGGIADKYIQFADPNVKAICVANWDTDGDGELSYQEAAAVTSVGTVFSGNTDIATFDELQFFTSLTTIPNNAFSGCKNLSSLILPETITLVGNKAFNECSCLMIDVNLPNLTSLGTAAFLRCGKLKSVISLGSITKMGNEPLALCTSMTSVILPSTLGSISWHAMYGCSNLTDVTIPNGVTGIDDLAFYQCGKLTSVSLPAGITNLGTQAFKNCSSLTAITIYATTPPTLKNGNAFDGTNNCPIYVPAGSVSAYQSEWSAYASRIQAIPTN